MGFDGNGDVEQEGEEELRKKREKRGRRWGGMIWAGFGWLGGRSLASDCGWS